MRRNYFKLRLLRFVVIPICDFAKKNLVADLNLECGFNIIKAVHGINITADLENRLLTFGNALIFFFNAIKRLNSKYYQSHFLDLHLDPCH